MVQSKPNNGREREWERKRQRGRDTEGARDRDRERWIKHDHFPGMECQRTINVHQAWLAGWLDPAARYIQHSTHIQNSDAELRVLYSVRSVETRRKGRTSVLPLSPRVPHTSATAPSELHFTEGPHRDRDVDRWNRNRLEPVISIPQNLDAVIGNCLGPTSHITLPQVSPQNQPQYKHKTKHTVYTNIKHKISKS